jgi:hypothetical protein
MSIESRRSNLKSIMREELPYTFGKGAVEAIIGLDETNYEINLDNDSRILNLENNATIYQVFSYVGTSTSGTVTIPEEATIFDIYDDGILDAISVVADENNNPTEVNSLNSSGNIVQVLSLNNAGEYTLDSIPNENACILYFIKVLDKYKSNVPEDSILGSSILDIAGSQEVLASGVIKNIVLNILNNSTYQAGQLSYDMDSFTILADTGLGGVRVNIGQEEHYLVWNPSAVTTLLNGKVAYASGVDPTNSVLTADYADNSSFSTSAQVIGLFTMDIPPLSFGLVTERGVVRDFNTTGLTTGLTYLSTNGDMTPTKPLYPAARWIMGVKLKDGITDGLFMVTPRNVIRKNASRSYSFTSQGIVAGTYWKAGFYDFNTSDANLSQASLTITHGIAGRAYGAHAGMVPSGAGIVDTGQVGLRVVGIKDFEDGTPQQAGQIGIITEDITTLALNTYYETNEKFSGQITFELYIVSGSPTVYSLDFNYGYAKYEDAADVDFTITAFEAVWLSNSSANTLDIALMKHTPGGWTYASTGFLPGNGDICRKTVDMPLAGDTTLGIEGAYKRTGLTEFIDGNGNEGVVIQVTPGGNNTIQTMDMHIVAVSEELD